NATDGDVWHCFIQAEDGIRDRNVTGVQTCALPIMSLQIRSKNRLAPSSPFSLHAMEASSGPMNISYRRKVSAPCEYTISSGFTTFPLDLLIFSLPSPRIIPWLYSFWNGSLVGTSPIS